jgi:hypothetical protein
MRAELEASLYTGTHGLGLINVLDELDFWQWGNILYTDNFANFKFCDGRMSLQSKGKHAEIRQLLILEWIKTNKLTMEWQPTTEMCADIGTKNLAVAQFTNFITGYHFAQVVLEQRVSTDDRVSNTIMSFLYGRVAKAENDQKAEIEETTLRRRAGRVDYWQGDHHATAGSKERVEHGGSHTTITKTIAHKYWR